MENKGDPRISRKGTKQWRLELWRGEVRGQQGKERERVKCTRFCNMDVAV